MSEGKHTPGPWRREPSLLIDDLSFIVDANELTIAHVWDLPRSAEENGANARLVAASPTMLEALHKIVNNWGNLHPKDREQARAAIAKAEGRT